MRYRPNPVSACFECHRKQVRGSFKNAGRAARSGGQPSLLQIGLLAVDFAQRQAQGPGGPVHLTPLEFRVLECLARAQGLIVTRDRIVREVWGPGRVGDARNLRVYVKLLRRKTEPEPDRPRFLLTEAGVGYRLEVY